MIKSKLLIIYKGQLGTLTDLTKWCEYLRDEYEVFVTCFDSGLEKISIENVHVKYISSSGSYMLRGLRFTVQALISILLFSGKIMVVYYEHCDVLKRLFFFKKMILDIRTLAINKDEVARKKYNRNLVNVCKAYDLISVISEGVKEKIGDVGRKVCVLPLGADCISTASKVYSPLKLIYVGTFDGRDIDKTIRGIGLFLKKHPESSIKYDVIGSGKYDKLEDLKNLTTSLGLYDVITFHGRIPNHLLTPYFDEANVGVSFVPITEYYDSQPPTKTFEYALSGLFVIATATNANKEVITSDNGILIKDTPEDFCHALELIYKRQLVVEELRIRESLKSFLWSNIVNEYLKLILNRL